MNVDIESGNFIGTGETATLGLLRNITGLEVWSRNQFFLKPTGLFKQIPISWIMMSNDLTDLSEAHRKGSIDIMMKDKGELFAIRIQGKGHSGAGKKHHGKFHPESANHKSNHDRVQKQLLEKYCKVIDIEYNECPNIFKERINHESEEELIDSFKTSKISFVSIIGTRNDKK